MALRTRQRSVIIRWYLTNSSPLLHQKIIEDPLFEVSLLQTPQRVPLPRIALYENDTTFPGSQFRIP